MINHATDFEDDPTRAFARALFGRDDETEQTDETDETAAADETADEHKPPIGNFVPNEGNVPENKDNTDAQFVRDLFGY